jgi:hypothetical protein
MSCRDSRVACRFISNRHGPTRETFSAGLAQYEQTKGFGASSTHRGRATPSAFELSRFLFILIFGAMLTNLPSPSTKHLGRQEQRTLTMPSPSSGPPRLEPQTYLSRTAMGRLRSPRISPSVVRHGRTTKGVEGPLEPTVYARSCELPQRPSERGTNYFPTNANQQPRYAQSHHLRAQRRPS